MPRNVNFTGRRALIISDTLPWGPAGSGADDVGSHVAALCSLGWQIDYVATHSAPPTAEAIAAMTAAGMACHHQPGCASVEVLRHRPGTFELVYLHRFASVEAFAPMIRESQPGAHVLFNPGGLSYLRLVRQAGVQHCTPLLGVARALRNRELAAIRQCDGVLVASSAEAAALRDAAPELPVHVVAWAPAMPRSATTIRRRGIAFIGGYRQVPNPDAMRWLIGEVMPHVWAATPGLPLLIAGSDWPDSPGWTDDPRIHLLGSQVSLAPLLEAVAMTVAPLRFGIGLHGKVLDSFAAGVPCVMSPIAAEGLPLDPDLRQLVCDTPVATAERILALHNDAAAAAELGAAGRAMVNTYFSPARIATALAVAIPGTRPSAALPAGGGLARAALAAR